MPKDELLSISDGMCEQLLDAIKDNQYATKDEIADLLIESARLIMNTENEKISNISFAELLFSSAYKDLANKSISSYRDSNLNFDKLSQMQNDAIVECSVKDIPALTSKFDEIHSYMKEEVNRANGIIKQLSTQIESLEKKSKLDALTKVYNRRALSAYMKLICSDENKAQNRYVLLLDIDDFKNVNDTHGHIAGDKVLIFVANMLKKALRDGDKVFRYGGEEFLIVLNRLDNKECLKISQRLVELIAENKLLYKGKSLKVTVSIGIGNFIDGDTPDSVIERADKALYKAKNNGKNQICEVNE